MSQNLTKSSCKRQVSISQNPDENFEQSLQVSSKQEGESNLNDLIEAEIEEINDEEESLTSEDNIDQEEINFQDHFRWGAKNKMKLGFRTGEKVLVKEETRVSIIQCPKREKQVSLFI